MLLTFLLVLQFLFSTANADGPCPDGTTYESQFKKCYKYYAQAMSFLAAERTCEQIGGNLVSITNAYENSYVSGFVAGNTKVQIYWLGASMLLSTSWSWTSGQAYSYQNWASQQPSDPSQYQCASARDVDYQWTKELCGSSRPFVCQIDLNGNNQAFCSYSSTQFPTNPSPTPTSTGGCPGTVTCSSGYTLFQGDCMCYKYDDSIFRSFQGASDYCKADGGQLVKITSQAQNDFLTSLTGRTYCNGGYCPHIGLQCTGTSIESCSWTDGTKLTGYNNFYPYGYVTAGDFYLDLESSGSSSFGYWLPEGYGSCATLCQKKSTTFADLAKERDDEHLTPIASGEHYKNNYKS